jgi:hypothetical protein
LPSPAATRSEAVVRRGAGGEGAERTHGSMPQIDEIRNDWCQERHHIVKLKH